MNSNDASQMDLANSCYYHLNDRKINVLLDDRYGKTLKEKTELSDFYGIPIKIMIGKQEIKTNMLSIKKRGLLKSDTILFDINKIKTFID